MRLKFTKDNVKTLPAGKHSDTDTSGLYLWVRVNPNTGNKSRSFQMLYTFNGKPGTITLGTPDKLTPAEARTLVKAKQVGIAKGIDPNAKMQASAPVALQTFRQHAEAYLAQPKLRKICKRYRYDWEQSLVNHVYKPLGDRVTGSLTPKNIEAVFSPLWGKLISAQSILDRVVLIIDRVIDLDEVSYPKGNPAAIARRVLGRWDREQVKHGALPWQEAPDVYQKLVALGDDVAAQGLRFLLLCCTPRKNEISEAEWAEIDGDRFRVPASRMKSRVSRSIPLSQAAQDLLREIAGKQTPYLFPNQRTGKRAVGQGCMNSDAMRVLFQRLVALSVPASRSTKHRQEIVRRRDPKTGRFLDVHGLRSTFRQWVTANATTIQDDRACEIALDHVIGTKVSRDYDRDDMFVERHNLAERWAAFLMSTAAVA